MVKISEGNPSELLFQTIPYVVRREQRSCFLTLPLIAQRGPPDYRRDDRYRDDRYERGDRYRDPPPRRDRSRSPYRRDYDRYDDKRYDDRRGPRSPPARRDVDDRRAYDDRRDSRRDDRRDPDERRNGDGGWHRGGGR